MLLRTLLHLDYVSCTNCDETLDNWMFP